ncbi:endonuclease domain-containing protein [Devosia sp. LjRoot16]|uniref:endonuclease domain-containing protein n=1 Tax=Devosia sp. LjRoot16 TaxID=3342271 RepID=UPI003ED01718
MTVERARELRHNATDPERKLWAILRVFSERGYHFRRQQQIGPYYADFACMHAQLIIEADGETHTSAAGRDHDRVRDDYLHARGFRVLRFWNNEITENAEGVFTIIEQTLATVPALTPTLDPSPQGGGRRKSRKALRDLAIRTGD